VCPHTYSYICPRSYYIPARIYIAVGRRTQVGGHLHRRRCEDTSNSSHPDKYVGQLLGGLSGQIYRTTAMWADTNRRRVSL